MTNWDNYESIVSAAATALLRAQTLRGRGSQVIIKDGRSLNVLSMVNHRDAAEEFDHIITDGATEAESGFFFSNEILSILDTKTGERIFHRVA